MADDLHSDLVEQTGNTTTMTYGLLISKLGDGQSCNALDISRRHERVMLLLLLMMLYMSSVVGVWMAKTWVIWLLSRFPVRFDLFFLVYIV